MTFREIPPQHAPLGDALYYAVGSDRAQTFEVRIRSDSGELLGAKRFAGVAEARFDLAPYLRRIVRFTPVAGGTGPVAATGRTVTATAEAGERSEQESTAAVMEEASSDADELPGDAVHDPDRAAVTKSRPEGLESTAPKTITNRVESAPAEAGGEAAKAAPNGHGSTAPKTIPDELDSTPAETDGGEANEDRVSEGTAESHSESALRSAASHAARSKAESGTVSEEEHGEERKTESIAATFQQSNTESDTAKSGSVTALAARAEPDGWHLLTTAPQRTFLACETPVAAPALLTTIPLCRMIGPAECDELTLLTAGPIRVAVTARSPYSDTAEVHRIQSAGLHLFRVDLGDFPDAETLTVEAEACGTVCYTVVPPPEGACRLAWRSQAGSIEHYTFPVVLDTTVRVVRQRATSTGGAARWKERTTTLRSAYEVREVLEPLSEILSAPQVWLLQNGSYTPVEVASDQATVQRHGAMSFLEIVLRSKTRTPWN
ncbi:hypothetical protein [Alistipes sp.]|uniref:hypothetical protein n=1 Tax=Alistipes sp. TaxID=1872444 RepID=UPI003AF027AB